MGRADSRRRKRREHAAKPDEMLVLEHEPRPHRRGRRITAIAVIGVVLLGLVVTWMRLPTIRDSSFMQHRDANAAISALRDGDLVAVEKHLEANRGKPDFAYFFASQATPRALGDALGTAAGEKAGELRKGIDPHQYELTITDLAGTLALATYGTDDRALPTAWARDFATATTTPDTSKKANNKRADQDQADKQNLLLLLARGHWSIAFLQTVTKAYWTYDHDQGDDAWPGTKADDAKYAPAPNGTYLTDGILALTAALTANPAASAWAFTDFQPGTRNVEYDGSDHALGKFSYYLFFEHQFPKPSDGDAESLGMTATLTALSSAIDTVGGAATVQNAADAETQDLVQPMADSRILQGLAKTYNKSSGCSWNPLDYGHCVVAVAKWLWAKIERWGHTVLNILSLATFAPPPFGAIGVAAAVTNATWYAIDGDYAEAGLALAAAIPGLSFGKFVKAGKEGVAVAKSAVDGGEAGVKIVDSAAQSAKLSKVASAWRWVKTPAAKVGRAASKDYRKTFFNAHPDLDPAETVVHHAVEQSVLIRYPGEFTEQEIHSLENLRGIPKDLNATLHVRDIKILWERFYKAHPAATRAEILKFATKVDRMLGYSFVPPIG